MGGMGSPPLPVMARGSRPMVKKYQRGFKEPGIGGRREQITRCSCVMRRSNHAVFMRD
jgi:hypothetical protein